MALLFLHDELHDQLYVRVFQARCEGLDQRWDARDVRSAFWRLYVNNRDGAGLLLPGGGRFALAAGRVHLVPAWVRFSCHNEVELEHFYVHFDLIGLPPALVRQLFASPLTLPDGPAALVALVEEIRQGLRGDGAVDLEILCRLKSLVHLAFAAAVHLLSAAQRAQLQQILDGEQPLRPAVTYIAQHLHCRIGVGDLAELCHLSDSHFIRRFRAALGQTPTQYIVEQRVAAAARKLVFSQDSIEEIAQNTGFPDRFYFTRVFAQRMGISPAAYRRTSRV